MGDKLVCRNKNCRWTGPRDKVLRAVSPFDPEEDLLGCPKCKDVNSVVLCCDEPGCTREVSCGTPMPDGSYRSTCGEHAP